MTETSADWVERPKPTAVAARTTRPVPPPSVRPAQQASPAVPSRLVGAGAAAVALALVMLLRRRRRR